MLYGMSMVSFSKSRYCSIFVFQNKLISALCCSQKCCLKDEAGPFFGCTYGRTSIVQAAEISGAEIFKWNFDFKNDMNVIWQDWYAEFYVTGEMVFEQKRFRWRRWKMRWFVMKSRIWPKDGVKTETEKSICFLPVIRLWFYLNSTSSLNRFAIVMWRLMGKLINPWKEIVAIFCFVNEMEDCLRPPVRVNGESFYL